jgi:hypothetical protein
LKVSRIRQIPIAKHSKPVYNKTCRYPDNNNNRNEYNFILYGGIAQLGERLNGIQEASGSIPLISTKTQRRKTRLPVGKAGFRWPF